MNDPERRPWKVRGVRRHAGPGGPCHFIVTLERGPEVIPDLQVGAAELLDYRAFREYVLKMSGRLVRFRGVEAAADPAAAWLDVVEAALPDEPLKRPVSGFHPSPPPSRDPPQDAVPQQQEIGGGD